MNTDGKNNLGFYIVQLPEIIASRNGKIKKYKPFSLADIKFKHGTGCKDCPDCDSCLKPDCDWQPCPKVKKGKQTKVPAII